MGNSNNFLTFPLAELDNDVITSGTIHVRAVFLPLHKLAEKFRIKLYSQFDQIGENLSKNDTTDDLEDHTTWLMQQYGSLNSTCSQFTTVMYYSLLCPQNVASSYESFCLDSFWRLAVKLGLISQKDAVRWHHSSRIQTIWSRWTNFNALVVWYKNHDRQLTEIVNEPYLFPIGLRQL